MLRIGIVGGTKDYHARTFSEMFNGYDRKKAVKNKYPIYTARVKGSRVTHVWDEDKKNARLLSEICGIENIVERKEDLIGLVDGVIICDDCTMKHQRRAYPFLEAGLPTMIDKPLSPDVREADKIVEFARAHHAPFMSCSALRYAGETAKIRDGKDDLGEILTGVAAVRQWQGDVIFYGIHAMELLYSVTGPGIKSVRSLGEKKRNIVLLNYKDGRRFVLAVYNEIAPTFEMTLYGTKDTRRIKVEDGNYFYSSMLREFTGMVATKKEPFPPCETLEIIRVLASAVKSRERGGREYRI